MRSLATTAHQLKVPPCGDLGLCPLDESSGRALRPILIFLYYSASPIL